MKFTYLLFIIILLSSCENKEGFTVFNGQQIIANGCDGVSYGDWETSPHVLPYPVGKSYKIGLSHCGGETHLTGEPDQFAINFVMDIGTSLTACRKGTIMFVRESGDDYGPVNNMVILRDDDGYFIQYQNLTLNGALVDVGDIVAKGDPIALSGASGANAPYLHLVFTQFGDWMYPYSRSYPINFSNTSPNPKSLIQDETYIALPYEMDE